MKEWYNNITLKNTDKINIENLKIGCEYLICFPNTKTVYNKIIYIGPHSNSENHLIFMDSNNKYYTMHTDFYFYSFGRIISSYLPDKIPEDIKLSEISLFF
jgi:hypothetical protein